MATFVFILFFVRTVFSTSDASAVSIFDHYDADDQHDIDQKDMEQTVNKLKIFLDVNRKQDMTEKTNNEHAIQSIKEDLDKIKNEAHNHDENTQSDIIMKEMATTISNMLNKMDETALPGEQIFYIPDSEIIHGLKELNMIVSGLYQSKNAKFRISEALGKKAVKILQDVLKIKKNGNTKDSAVSLYQHEVQLRNITRKLLEFKKMPDVSLETPEKQRIINIIVNKIKEKIITNKEKQMSAEEILARHVLRELITTRDYVEKGEFHLLIQKMALSNEFMNRFIDTIVSIAMNNNSIFYYKFLGRLFGEIAYKYNLHKSATIEMPVDTIGGDVLLNGGVGVDGFGPYNGSDVSNMELGHNILLEHS